MRCAVLIEMTIVRVTQVYCVGRNPKRKFSPPSGHEPRKSALVYPTDMVPGLLSPLSSATTAVCQVFQARHEVIQVSEHGRETQRWTLVHAQPGDIEIHPT